MKVKVKLLSCVQLFATLWIVAHRIFQARILEWVSISFSRGSSWPRDQTRVSLIAARGFTSEPPGSPIYIWEGPKILRPKLIELKEVHGLTVINGTSLLTSQLIERTTRHKMTKHTEDMNTIKQLNLTFYRTLQSTPHEQRTDPRFFKAHMEYSPAQIICQS